MEQDLNKLSSIVDGKEVQEIFKPGQPQIQAESGDLAPGSLQKAPSLNTGKPILESEIIRNNSQRPNREPAVINENAGEVADENIAIRAVNQNNKTTVSQLFNPAQLMKPAGADPEWKESGGDGGGVTQTLDLKDLFKPKRRGQPNDIPDEKPQTGKREWANWVNPAFTPAAKVVPQEHSQAKGGEKDGHDGVSLDALGLLFQSTAKDLKEQKQKFSDKQFPPELKSIEGHGDIELKEQYRKYVWKRPQEMFEENFNLCSKGVEPNDVRQGDLGDCYFICALSALAEKPERAKRIILSKNFSEEGVYSVALCITGVWEEVIVDDLFPWNLSKKKPAFSQSRSNDLWVMLLEKAWAKVHGGYLNIESGFTSEALFSLTGAPVYTYFISNENSDKNWQAILDGEANNYIMTASTGDFNSSGNDAQDKQTGLSASHGYSLLAGVVVDHQGQKLRLVKLRNPWGTGEWRGDWSDNSPLWTPELKAKLEVKAEDDGIFFMSFEDWQKYFTSFDICYYHDSFKHSAIKLQSDPDIPTVLRFTITKSGPWYFMVSQTNSRMFKKANKYFYSGLTLIVCRVGEDKVHYIGDANEFDELLWFKNDCEPGEYLAYIMTPWRSMVNEFGFGVYGPEKIKLRISPPDSLSPNFIASVMTDKAQGNYHLFKNFAARGEPDIKSLFEINSEALTYFYFENSSPQTTLKSRIVFTEMEDIFVFPPHEVKEIFQPNQQKRMFEVSQSVETGRNGIIMCKMNSEKSKLQITIYSSFESAFGCPGCKLI